MVEAKIIWCLMFAEGIIMTQIAKMGRNRHKENKGFNISLEVLNGNNS